MDSIKQWFNGTGVNPWVYSTVVFLVVLSVGFLVKKLIWGRLEKWAEKTESQWDNQLLSAISSPMSLLLVVLAFGIAGQSAPQLVREHPLMRYGVKVALILAVFWILERGISIFFRSSALPETLNATTRTLLLTIARVVISVLGLLIVLDTIGVPITPLLASLGIGSLAVALALQDTLGNFFNGFYLLVDRPIRIGDLVAIEGIEGEVQRIGWRSTRIKTGTGDAVTLPNSKVASAYLKNFDMPTTFSMFSVPIGVDYESDLEHVERVTVDVAREVLGRVQGGDKNFEPVVRFTALADSSINFNVVLQCLRYSDVSLVKHEFIKAIMARYKREGISVPYPQQVIHWDPGPNP